MSAVKLLEEVAGAAHGGFSIRVSVVVLVVGVGAGDRVWAFVGVGGRSLCVGVPCG